MREDCHTFPVFDRNRCAADQTPDAYESCLKTVLFAPDIPLPSSTCPVECFTLGVFTMIYHSYASIDNS